MGSILTINRCQQWQHKNSRRPPPLRLSTVLILLTCLLFRPIQKVAGDDAASWARKSSSGGRMTLSEFQSILRTFVDDEMAYVVDSLQHGYGGSPPSSESTSGINGATAEVALEKSLQSEVANIDGLHVDTGGRGHHLNETNNRGRRLAHRNRGSAPHQHERRTIEHRRWLSGIDGRYTEDYPEDDEGGNDRKSDPASVPDAVLGAWEDIISHAWNIAKSPSPASPHSAMEVKRSVKPRNEGRRVEEESESRASNDGSNRFPLLDVAAVDGAQDGEESSEDGEITKLELDTSNDEQEEIDAQDFPPLDGTIDFMQEVPSSRQPQRDGAMHSNDDINGMGGVNFDWNHGILMDDFDEEEGVVTPDSFGLSSEDDMGEQTSLFLTCHHSSTPLSGNDHLRAIVTRSGQDDNAALHGDTSSYNVVVSSPNRVCIIMHMNAVYAGSLAALVNDSEEEEEAESYITIVPWVDVMKISPGLFAQLVSSVPNSGSNSNGESSIHSTRRGLRNFRRATAMAEEQEGLSNENDDPLLWEEEDEDVPSLEHNQVIFTMASPTNSTEDAMNVIQDVIGMARHGRERSRTRRRMTSKADHNSDEMAQDHRRMSIQDAFSLTRRTPREGSPSHSSWSHIFSRGLESTDDEESVEGQTSTTNACISTLEGIVLESFVPATYEFSLVRTEPPSTPKPTPECVASIVAGLSTHHNILNVGLLTKSVTLNNIGASWVVQGAVESNGWWKRPLFDAGLDGTGQVVSVSDTGLDMDNCYFKDERGNGSVLDQWEYGRRKIVRYEVSTRGGDTEDTVRGHGTHVAGTVAGRHAFDTTLGNDDDPKEGVAPGAKLHIYDIGKGYTVNDPRRHWFESFHNEDPRKGAKIATGSWGFGYRQSYDWVCELYDQVMVDYPDVLYVSSVGNTGNKFDSPWNTVSAPASCKNVFAVGAVNSANFGKGLHYALDFTSRGPTADGRTKPDILAPGYALNSAKSGSHDCKSDEVPYYKAGTSIAAPVIAGVGALVRQYFQMGYYPCGRRECGETVNPTGALIKAVIINGAQGTQGVQKGGSTTILHGVHQYDNIQNYGETNLLTSLPLQGENDFNIYVEDNVALSAEKSWYIDLNFQDCASDFSATLAWYDPPGAQNCMRCIMNDLDLEVENLSISTKYHANGKSGPDTLNNVERVRIAKGEASTNDRLKVTLKASMLSPGFSSQNYALVMTGCFASVNDNELISKVPPVSTISSQLTTTYNANRKQAGNMFGIKAKTDGITITSFAIHTLVSGRDIKLHVYTLNTGGGVSGTEYFLDQPDAWTRISPSSGIEVRAKGFNVPTVIPTGSFKPVPITRGTTQSFYITFTDEAEMLYQAVDTTHPTGAVFENDNNIEIMTGVGKGANFGTTWQSRQLNGAVYYTKESTSQAGSSTVRPTPRPTNSPTKQPTNRPSNKPSKEPTNQPTDRPVSQSVTHVYKELETTYKANKKQAGNMFDVYAKQNVAISSFKIHTLLRTKVTVTIYSRVGSWKNHDKDPSAWEKMASVSVDCKGYGVTTIVSGIPPISISEGSMQAFYLTLDEPELLYQYSEGQPSGAVFSEDSAIKIYTGIGKAGYFGATYLSRQLNGALVYYQ